VGHHRRLATLEPRHAGFGVVAMRAPARKTDIGTRGHGSSSLARLSLVGCFPGESWASHRRVPLDNALPNEVFVNSAAPESRRTGSRSAPAVKARALDPELPPIGGVVDKYRLEELLGLGGFAAVYRATHLLLQRSVALKLLRPSVIRRRPAMVPQLCEEARFVARINHPNVVRVYDVTHSDEITYIVMEYIDGQALSKLVRKNGVLAPLAVVNVGLDVAAGLSAGLEQGLVHRDVKPANIIVTRDGQSKIVDLGLARSVAGPLDREEGGGPASASSSGAPSSLRTEVRSARYVGTHGYIDPRQWTGAIFDFRSDVYSLGATLYHAAMGIPPLWADDPLECLRLHATTAVRPPCEERSDIPRSLSDLLLRMLEKDADKRPSSYAELQEDLLAVQTELTSSRRTTVRPAADKGK
jgi:serine/threonine-protein kinase